MTANRFVIVAALVSALAPLSAVTASAQSADAVESPAAQQTGGPMVVERVHSGFVVVPDFKFTEIDHHNSGLAGVYAGWLAEETFFIGGGGYWLTNGSHDRGMGYGGLVTGVMIGTNKPIGFSAKILLGGGEAELTDSVAYPVPGPRGTVTYATQLQHYHQPFFIAEPDASLLLRVTPGVHVSLGVGYRYIGNYYYHDYYYGPSYYGDTGRLSGATASIGVQIGGR